MSGVLDSGVTRATRQRLRPLHTHILRARGAVRAALAGAHAAPLTAAGPATRQGAGNDHLKYACAAVCPRAVVPRQLAKAVTTCK